MIYGSYGLKAIEPERVIGKQIEAARVALTRHMKRQGRVSVSYTHLRAHETDS